MVFWICMAAGLPLNLLVFAGGEFAMLGAMLGGLAIIAGLVSLYMLHYQLWKLIPVDIARSTPGKAVGFCFIPFYNFYWYFIAWKGLGEDMTKTLQRHGIQHQINEALGLTVCILAISCFIPFLGQLLYIAWAVVMFFFLKSIKDGAIALIEKGGA